MERAKQANFDCKCGMPCQHTRRHGKHKALLKTYQWQTRGCPFNLSKCLFCNAECLEPNCQENSACTRAGKQHYLPIVWFPGIWKLDCGLWSSLRVKGGGGEKGHNILTRSTMNGKMRLIWDGGVERRCLLFQSTRWRSPLSPALARPSLLLAGLRAPLALYLHPMKRGA